MPEGYVVTSSTPPAWAWLEEEYQPVKTPELSIDPRKLPDSATLGVPNDSNPDPTYQDCWPSERYPSDGPDCAGVRSERERHTNLSVGAQNEHPPRVESCPECGTVTDIEYGQDPGQFHAPTLAKPLHLRSKMADRMAGTIDDNPLLNHMECTFNSCMDIAVAKNEGYAGNADPMANFNDSVRLGVPVPIGVALRLSDKWARLCRLLQTGKNPLADESITDTIMDAINYLAILLYALEDEGSPRR